VELTAATFEEMVAVSEDDDALIEKMKAHLARKH
jgi:hypothetical protein